MAKPSPSQPPRRRARRRPTPGGGGAGFTLLEVLIAVAILSLSLTSLVSSQVASLRSTAQARDLSSVVFLAESKLIDVEFELKKDGGWGDADKTFSGDFSDEGWPDVTYICVADLIEMPDYQQLVEAKDSADTDGAGGLGGVGGSGVQDAGEQAFDTIGMVWPIVKEAIEQSIRKSWCTVRWSDSGISRRTQGDDALCNEDEERCLTIMTFWTDPTKLMALPSAGGEASEDDDTVDGPDDGGGGDDGGSKSSGGGGGGGGRGGIGGAGGGVGGGDNTRFPGGGR
jgi:prepilin-type N-terminal cleavage/methylation domain-containing protein